MTFKIETDNTKLIKTIIPKGLNLQEYQYCNDSFFIHKILDTQRGIRIYNSEELMIPLSEYKNFVLNASY